MTKRRQLSGQERKWIITNLQKLQADIEYKEKVELARTIFALEVAPIEYKKQIKDLELKKKGLNIEVDELQKAVNVLQEQLTKGVEEKNLKGGKQKTTKL